MKVTEAMVKAGIEAYGELCSCEYPHSLPMQRAIEAAIEQGERDCVATLIEASRDRKPEDPIAAINCAVIGCACGYWHTAWCNKCGHAQSITLCEHGDSKP